MKTLVLDDGIPGNTNQSIGIAESLQINFDVLNIKFRGPTYRLPGRKGSIKVAPKIIGFLLCLKAYKLADFVYRLLSVTDVNEQKYDTVISAGSFLAPINLLISKKFGAKSVCIMTPEGVPLKNFDILFVPLHDFIRYPQIKKLKNVVPTIGAPNRITSHLLEKSREKLMEKIKIPDNTIKIGLIIGGNDQNYSIDVDWAKELLKTLQKLKETDFSYLLTVSRRTPQDVAGFLWNNSMKPNFVYREFPGVKPGQHYFGILSVCDILFVTEDSITMISETCSTGKPVIVLGVKRKKNRRTVFDTTISKLVEGGYCVYVQKEDLEKIPELLKTMLRKGFFPVLNESEKCAEKIAELLNKTKF